MFEWLADRSGQNILTNEEQVIFWKHFAGYAMSIQSKVLSIAESRRLVQRISNTLRSQTTAIMRVQGYVFDGLLGQTGGGQALLYHVIKLSTGEIKCGKVYAINRDTEEILSAERNGSSEVHIDGVNPYVVHYEDALSFKHQGAPYTAMIALIMPLFQRNLTSVLDAFFEMPLQLNMFLKVATCVLSAGARFHELKKAHCDIKPENIMMLGSEFIVIDLGAVCSYGEQVREYTPGYNLDAPLHILTPVFDLNCAAVTLARCCLSGFEVKQGLTKEELSHRVTAAETYLDRMYTDVLRACLRSADCGAALAVLHTL